MAPEDVDRQIEGGPINWAKNAIRPLVSPSRYPTEGKLGYESISALYGATARKDKSGQWYVDYTGPMPFIDRIADRYIVRSQEDHIIKDPLTLLAKKPEYFLHLLTTGPKRSRGPIQEILANIERLGLNDRYKPYYDKNGKLIGIAFVNNFIEEGRTLRNIYRAKLIKGADELLSVDRLQAVEAATKYIKKIHDEKGGIGELLCDDIIFTKLEDGYPTDPVLAIPDIIFNKKASLTEVEKKAIDLLDFIADVAEEESSVDNPQVKDVINKIISTYDDPHVAWVIDTFLRRGRLTLAGDKYATNDKESIPKLPYTVTTKQRPLLAIHNQVRLRIKEDFALKLKKMIVDSCKNFYEERKWTPPWIVEDSKIVENPIADNT